MSLISPLRRGYRSSSPLPGWSKDACIAGSSSADWRQAFAQACTMFEQLGAPTWAQQASSELARVGPRRRAPDELTATELRVAGLAAAGMTNREVAQVTYMSAKTVEAHLASVYRKLGIRSRAQLGARVAALAPAGAPRT